MNMRRAGNAVQDWMVAQEEASKSIVAKHKAKVAALLVPTDGAADDLKVASTPPVTASPNIIAAPARGPQLVEPQFETVQTPSGPRTRRATQDGFHPVRRADAFDMMALQHKRAGGQGTLFTVAQVEAGRAYAALCERVSAEGMRCSSPEARTGGGGQGVDWIEGVIGRTARLARMRAAVGSGWAVEAGDVPGKRTAILVLTLVDRVCVHRQGLGQVLNWHGWPVKGETRAVLQRALCAALDRLHGC